MRWILPGQLDTAVAGWFGRFPAGMDSREDGYLIHPVLRVLRMSRLAGQRAAHSRRPGAGHGVGVHRRSNRGPSGRET